MINGVIVESFFSNPQFETLMCNLAGRWLDECAYEDIRDYKEPIAAKINEILGDNDIVPTMVMTKRPFGFKAVVPYTYRNGATRISILVVKMSAKGSYEWSVKLAA